MAKIHRVNYYTQEKYDLVSLGNMNLYEKYLRSNSIRNKDTFETSYQLYERNFMFFLVFLAEEYNNIGLYSDKFLNNAVEIVEDYMAFCASTLKNSKKTINNKVNAICSFYKWSNKRNLIPSNPLSDKVERIKNADEEKIVNEYFLTKEQVATISETLLNYQGKKYDFQDTLLWFIFLDSANRIGAIEQLAVSKLNKDKMVFENIIEKERRNVDVAFTQPTLELIELWLEMRKDNYDLMSCDALFITKYGKEWKPMSRRAIQNRVQKIGKIVGISDLHPHCIRKSSASNMLDDGVDSYLISQYLNHRSMDVLRHYIKPKSSSDLRKQIDEQLKKEDYQDS